jgi:hypothetical protein
MTFRGYMVKVNHCPLHSFKVNKDGVGLIEMQVRGTHGNGVRLIYVVIPSYILLQLGVHL